MSLSGKRVLVTRSREQASELAARLELMGAAVIQVPTLEIAPPLSFCALDAALTCLRSFDWVVFTSANAVRVFAERVRRLGISAAPKKIAVVGPATAKAVETIGLAVDAMPKTYVAEALGVELAAMVAGSAVLLIRAEVAPETLPVMLREAGAEVTVVSAYRTVVPEASMARLKELFADARSLPDAITFTSASTVTNLVKLLEACGVVLSSETMCVSIGPVTSSALREAGLTPHTEAKNATLESLCAAVERCVGSTAAATPHDKR